MRILQNEELRLTFDDHARLVGLSAADGSVEIPIDAKAVTDAFEVELRTAGGEVLHVSPQAAPQIAVHEEEDAQTLVATWEVAGDWGEIIVRGKVCLAARSKLSAWTCETENHTDCAIWQVTYPRVSGLTAFDTADGPDWLAGSCGAGEKTPDPVHFVNNHQPVIPSWARRQYGTFDFEGGPADIAYSYPGMWAMQYVSYYHPATGGIYFAAHDGEALYKRFGLYADPPVEQQGDGRHAALAMKQYPRDRTAIAADFRSFYPSMIGVHRGEWWGASALYREWGVKQVWCGQGATRERTDIPQWTKDLDLWHWNLHHLEKMNHPVDIVPAIETLQNRFDCKLAFHWYAYNGEHTCNSMWRDPDTFPYCPDIREALVDGIKTIHELGAHVIPYINCRLWSPLSLSFKAADGMQWITVDEHGRSAHEWPRIGHTMCPTAPPFQELMRRLTNQMIDELGMDGAYLDQPTSCFAVPCFNTEHDHPPGGHDHWHRGHRDFLSKIRRDIKARSADNIITSEGQIECFLDLFDMDSGWSVSCLSSSVGSAATLPIPMFQSVYHDYHMTYGTTSCVDLSLRGGVPLEQFTFQDALCLVSGTQLMISGFFAGDESKEELKPQLDYVETLLAARKAGHDWLNFGVWKPPLALDCELVEVPFSAEFPAKQDIPAIITGCFELDGELCMVLVNHTDAERSAAAEIDPVGYGLRAETFVLKVVHPWQEALVSGVAGTLKQAVSLAPRSAQVWMLTPAL